jgi:hypothetical protein
LQTVGSLEDIYDIIDRGDSVRKIAETKMNAVSSRSHSVLSIYLEQTSPKGARVVSQMNLVDLAGSERADKTGATGEVLKQVRRCNHDDIMAYEFHSIILNPATSSSSSSNLTLLNGCREH